ncbi:DUF262 domain-containing protein [Haliangium ochraceum]|uniref:GmrSD restriction endonucleases N-terminal domain-containing protein n=1 Tax=Haliangium ochraceum (strain DSM 14365 / JCM 11303 / SMP-2) TaxID=502025 RepID=D0LY19_HALO1|nr:DUF262 domain-containing protein [Haliangium ochraceum]ACY14374.1 protein of unknown function DUF262 [Haliangium ochraceum DSM 14365]
MSVTTTAPLFRTLNRRPEATTITVRTLINKVLNGQVRVPRFQRPLRWRRDDVVKLLDSIWRGYPVGSLLFWKRQAPAESITVGGATLAAEATPDAWWVVDGQQRTTALAATLLELDHAGDTRWIVRFDPSEEAFLPGAPPPERQGVEVPVSVLGDLRRLGRWLRESAIDDEAIQRVEDAQQRLLDYSIPAYIVETQDEQALRGVFARMNSSGSRMRADEVFQALLGAPSTAGKASLDLDDLQRGCDRDGFGTPPRAEILKAVLAMSGMDPTRHLEDFGHEARNNLVSREDAAEALSRTIDFVMNDCGIPHIRLLPYPVVFFLLARWFHVHASEGQYTRQLLARWVWRGAAIGAHQRAAVSKMRDQMRAVEPGDEQASLDRLLQHVSSEPEKPWTLNKFQARSAGSRIETLALFESGPRTPEGPLSVAELASEGRIAREIFRSADCESLDPSDRELARTVANRALLGTSRTGLSTEFRTWRADEPALRTHFIDKQAFEFLRRGEVGGFLRHRAELVRAATDQFLRRKAAWDEPDLRPPATYLESQDA